jgi:uncharacterized protein (TIGR02246 family)
MPSTLSELTVSVALSTLLAAAAHRAQKSNEEEVIMAAQAPGELHQLFANALNGGNLQGLLDLYEPDASFVPQPGQVVKGTEAIRQSLQEFLRLKPAIRIETKANHQAGDLALLRSAWTLECTSPEGKPLKLSGDATEVARRQPNGDWLFSIDLPYGTE